MRHLNYWTPTISKAMETTSETIWLELAKLNERNIEKLKKIEKEKEQNNGNKGQNTSKL